MIIQCDRCQTTYDIDDAKVKPGETKVRCSQCQHVFTIPQRLTISEEEIFGSTNDSTEDSFIKEWAKEFSSRPEPELRKPAPPASAPNEGLSPRAFSPPAEEEALFAEEPSLEEASIPKEEMLPFKSSPVGKASARKERSMSTSFLLTMFLLLVIAGALYYWSQRGSSIPAFEYVYEKIYNLMEGKKDEKLFLLYLKGSEHVLEGGEVYIIQGKVANRSQETKKLVKLKGSLYDKSGKTVATSIGFCGISITDEEVKKSTYDALKDSFSFMPVAQARPVPPEESVPFTIIFFSPPEGATQFQVEIVEAEESA